MMLNEMIKDKKKIIQIRKEGCSLQDLQEQVTPSSRNFYEGFQGSKLSTIFECKKISPSQGVLSQDYDPFKLANSYEPFSQCISVVTDQKYFGGNLTDLQKVSRAVQNPVLQKDIILEPYQIYEGRKYGADAVLLMLSVLEDNEYQNCCKVAHELNMGVLTEVYTQSECERAIKLGAKVILINNRNLLTMQVDLGKTELLAPLIPNHIKVISGSGIQSHADIRKLTPFVDGFLIGSCCVESNEVDFKVRSLVFGRVKICGLNEVKAANLAYLSGATYGGLNCIPHSKRFISKEKASLLAKTVPLKWVGLFANENAKVISQFVTELGLDAVQLHGDETIEEIKNIKSKLPFECALWVAKTLDELPLFQDFEFIDKLLLDTKVDNQFGGTGKSFNWDGLKQVENKSKLILAGGINVNHIRAAEAIGLFALDVCSGVESMPGKTDLKKLKTLFEVLTF